MSQSDAATTPAAIEQLRTLVRDVPDFPQPGILFRDITPLLARPDAFHAAIELLAQPFTGVDVVVAIESRGFILGAPVALALGAGLAPVRKAGRLPAATIAANYALEYGTNTLEMHQDALAGGTRVLIVDDVLATGGTVEAAASLVERLGGEVIGVSLLIELAALEGRARLARFDVRSLLVY
jgi:adenine phosphoribosyltransferase